MMSVPLVEHAELPQPIRIHWAFVLIFSALTAGLFSAVWLIVQADWARRVRRKGWLTEGLTIAYAVVTLVVLIAALLPSQVSVTWMQSDYMDGVAIAFWVAAVYTLRSDLKSEPIGLPLGTVMPFFFGSTYFQYHLQEFGGSSSSGRPMGLSRLGR